MGGLQQKIKIVVHTRPFTTLGTLKHLRANLPGDKLGIIFLERIKAAGCGAEGSTCEDIQTESDREAVHIPFKMCKIKLGKVGSCKH